MVSENWASEVLQANSVWVLTVGRVGGVSGRTMLRVLAVCRSSRAWCQSPQGALSLKAQNSVFPCMSLMPPEQVAVPLPQPKVSAYESEFVNWSFKRMPRSPAALSLTWIDGISTHFQSQMLRGLFFLELVFQAGEPCMGLRPLPPQGRPLLLR